MENYVKFKRGTAAAFEALTTKDSDTLYFITNEDGSISVYLGAQKAGVAEDDLKGLLGIEDLSNVTIEDENRKNGYVLTYRDGVWVSESNPGANNAVDDLGDRVDELEDNLTKNYYTKNETNTAISTAITNAGHLKREVVDTLPEVANAAEDVIYLVLEDNTDATHNKYGEYMLINNNFERLGDWEVDLSNYVSTNDLATFKTTEIDPLDQRIENLEGAGYITSGALSGYVKSTDLAAELKTAENIASLKDTFVTVE